jgi:hypothetical protein
MMNSDVLPKTHATLRFSGDRINPSIFTDILKVRPDRGHRKGEVFYAGPRAGNLVGRTGIWWLSTQKHVDSDSLDDHLSYLVKLVSPTDQAERLARLREEIGREGAEVHVGCFWHGPPGAQAPTVSDNFRRMFARLSAQIETDFNTD